MKRWYYSNKISAFLGNNPDTILGKLSRHSDFAVETTQRDAWLAEIAILKSVLKQYQGTLFLEFSIPRMGRRVVAVVIIEGVIFGVEFKVNSRTYERADIDQVCDYGLDLKNFHESSHQHYVAPILVATHAPPEAGTPVETPHGDKTLFPINANTETLGEIIERVLSWVDAAPIDPETWAAGRYCPTPTIIEAATALYNNHSVADLSRNDAGAINLSRTSDTLNRIIRTSRQHSWKSICFVTGVPGAGKTLVGLNAAVTNSDTSNNSHGVYLSGNGPLVKVLREALVRDKVAREKAQGYRLTKTEARSEVKAFIQNVHSFRDEYLIDETPPINHVALFDEAQRAWTREQTVKFMVQKRKQTGFDMSEPQFLISCLDRHSDWAVIVCLVGGGQEINTGEAGIREWINALQSFFPDWHIWLSNQLTDSEYGSGEIPELLRSRPDVTYESDLHLSVSMRSYRAEDVSLLVKQLLDIESTSAQETLRKIENYPIVLTRDISKAKDWVRAQARGSERYGIVVSAQAERLKPYAIDVRPKIDPIHWFLNGKEDVRSSYYLEDVATEFHIQGLELDWACVSWDADLRFSNSGWTYKSFRGNKWQNINQPDRKMYLKNAYRVLLTRARQGMVIFVPAGDTHDPTRDPEFYDPTFNYLKNIGLPII